MSWIAVGAGAVSLAGSVYSANKNADAMEDANSGELPDWLKPYVIGDGKMPGFIENPAKINSNWMNYIDQMGKGDPNAQWQPMSSDNMFFHPEQQFTPDQGGGPYGQLPPGMTAPPPQQQPGGGMNMDAMTQFMDRMEGQNRISGMEDMPWSQGQRYNRGFRGMERPEFDKMDTLYQLMRRM